MDENEWTSFSTTGTSVMPARSNISSLSAKCWLHLEGSLTLPNSKIYINRNQDGIQSGS